jgi:hypothetical protein
MAVPGSYDNAGINIRVDPDAIFPTATVAIPSLGGDISDSVNRILQIWNDLKIGWVGNTAQEAQDFNDRWAASISELFGTQGDPSSGILTQITDGVALAASNYGQAEDVVTNMFNQATSSLSQNSSSDSTPDPHRAGNGPITENTPTMPSKGRVSPLPPSAAPNPWDVTPPAADPRALPPKPVFNPFDPSSAPPTPDPDFVPPPDPEPRDGAGLF